MYNATPPPVIEAEPGAFVDDQFSGAISRRRATGGATYNISR